MRLHVVSLSVALSLFLPNLVRADEIYTFSGNITPYYGLPTGAVQSFTYIASSFITQDTLVPASALSECSTGYNATCLGINFLVSSPGWGGGPGQVVQIAFTDGIVNPNYYFPLAAFTVNGTYSTVFYQGANTGILTVTVVPEPASGFLVMGPLATLLIRAYRKARKRDRLVVAPLFQ